MTNILTVTLNPCLDYATSVDHVVAGPKLRCKSPRIDPGGGGVNVARAIAKIGGDSTALLAVGGATGAQLIALLDAEDIRTHAVEVSCDTRQALAVTDESSGSQYRFGFPGLPLEADDAEHLVRQILSATEKNMFVVLSGSMPPGLPVDFPDEIFERIAPQTDRLVVDTSGAALAHLISAPRRSIYMLRIDQREATEAAGKPLDTMNDLIGFASDLVEQGVAEIIVSGRGSAGSIMVTKEQRFFCPAPYVDEVSTVGAGDAFVGALVHRLSLQQPIDDALRWGVAAAAATVMTEGTALCRLDDVERLLPECSPQIL